MNQLGEVKLNSANNTNQVQYFVTSYSKYSSWIIHLLAYKVKSITMYPKFNWAKPIINNFFYFLTIKN